MRTNLDDDVPDLRPGPWRAHGAICAVLAAAYVVLAWSAWPTAAPPPSGRLEQGLSILVGIGEGAAIGALIFGAAAVLFYVAVSTLALALAPRRWRDPWLVHALLMGGIAIAALLAR
jgi:uncharacterized membrane protein YhaH (DUF805 family)